jgi:hypothetical protein
MKIKYLISILSVLFVGCELVDPMAEEQYEKNVYIVGAYNRVSAFALPYGNAQEAFVSVALSGSLNTDHDVTVTLRQNNDIIDWYNGKYMLDAPVKYEKLDDALLNVPSWNATIRAGEVYALLPFSITSAGLHCDSLYAVGFEIASTSDYQLSPEDTELILTLKLTNEFSGAYQMEATKQTLTKQSDGSWIETGMPVPVSIQRTLTAVSADTLRFFHEKTKETLDEYSNSWDPGADYFNAINASCLKLGRIAGTNEFSVSAYGVFPVIEGSASYADGVMTFAYDYTEGSTRYRMKGTFTK